MIGITHYGGYIPKLRLDRMQICQAMGWFAPAIMAVAQGERSVCNWDEDALSMAVEASRDCLKGANKANIDALYLCSTTLPYADRQNAGIVKTALNMGDTVLTADFTSALKAGTSALTAAFDALAGGQKKNILVVASDKRETKGAYFYESWFGDGAASLLLGSENVIAEYKGSYSVSHDFPDHFRGTGFNYDYMWEERWVRDEGYSKIVPQAVGGLLNKLGMKMSDVTKFAFPCFFKAEHAKIARTLGASPDQVIDNMHEVCGETGTAHPFTMFISALEQAKPHDKILMAGFGQGCDALLFEVTDNIARLSPRKGVKGCLADRRQFPSYEKYCKFRDLIKVEMGIRAESGARTAMTTLWRKRKMITGLVGARCKKCGTPQWPPQQICVNPSCGSVKQFEDYEFADRKGRVLTWTADMLAVSWEPPCVYGIVQFDEGGRMLLDFTDCEQQDVKVGQPVRLSFRQRYFDKDRGYQGYFWKAIPVKEEAGKEASA